MEYLLCYMKRRLPSCPHWKADSSPGLEEPRCVDWKFHRPGVRSRGATFVRSWRRLFCFVVWSDSIIGFWGQLDIKTVHFSRSLKFEIPIFSMKWHRDTSAQWYKHLIVKSGACTVTNAVVRTFESSCHTCNFNFYWKEKKKSSLPKPAPTPIFFWML